MPSWPLSPPSNYVGFKAPGVVTTNLIWVLPAAEGANGQVLTTNGLGTLSWSTTGGTGDMLKSDNLSGLSNTATARSNLGLTSLATAAAVSGGTGGNHLLLLKKRMPRLKMMIYESN